MTSEQIEAIKEFRNGGAPSAPAGQVSIQRTDVRNIDADATDMDGDTLSARVSSDIPLDRGGLHFTFREVLHHSRRAVQLSDAKKNGIPLLFAHDQRGIAFGMGRKPELETENGVTYLRVAFEFEGTEESMWALNQVKSGLMKRLSVGWETLRETYTELETSATKENEFKKEPNVQFDIREWRPLEVSLVAIPADTSAGFRSSGAGEEKFIRAHTRSIFLPSRFVESDAQHESRNNSNVSDYNSNSQGNSPPSSQPETTQMSDTEIRNEDAIVEDERADTNTNADVREEPPARKRTRARAKPAAKPAADERADDEADERDGDEVVDRVEQFDREVSRYLNIGASAEDISAGRDALLSGEAETVRDAQAVVRNLMGERAKARVGNGQTVGLITEKSAERFDLGAAIKARLSHSPDEGFNREIMTDSYAQFKASHPEAKTNAREIPISMDMLRHSPGMASAMPGGQRGVEVGAGTAGIAEADPTRIIIENLVETTKVMSMYDRFPGVLDRNVTEIVETNDQDFVWSNEKGARGNDRTGHQYTTSRSWEYHNVSTAQRITDRAMDQEPQLHDLLMSRTMRNLMREIERRTIVGASASNQPDGIVEFDNIHTIEGGTNGSAVTLNNLIDLETNAAESFIDQVDGEYIYLTSYAAISQMRKTFISATGSDRRLVEDRPLMNGGSGASMITYAANGPRVYASDFIPRAATKGTGMNLHTLIGMKPKAMKMAFFSMPVFIVDPFSQADTGELLIRLRQAVSWNYTQLDAFGLRVDIDTTL